MENPEEVLHSLEEFAKMKPKDIPRELEEYLKFVAKTGDPVYQWSLIKSLFREKLINVITEFYESRSPVAIDIESPPSRNVEMFDFDYMKGYILERLETFVSAPFTLQRLCELLTSPRKEYTRVDKYMRALEKNILVVSTTQPGGRRTENGEGIMNGIESDHEAVPEPGSEINVEEMDDSSYAQQTTSQITECLSFEQAKNGVQIEINHSVNIMNTEKPEAEASTSSQEIVCVQYLSIEPVTDNTIESSVQPGNEENKEAVSVTITAINVKSEEAGKNVEQIEPDKATNVVENSEANVPEASEPTVCPIATTSEADMEIEPVQSSNETLQTSTEIPSSTTVPDNFTPEVNTLKTENENISPENSITSSDNSPCESSNDSNTLTEIPTSNFTSENSEKATTASESVTQEVELPETAKSNDAVDSTTKAAGDVNIESHQEATSKVVEEVGSSKEIEPKPDQSKSDETVMETSEVSGEEVKGEVVTDLGESSSSEASN